MGAHYRVLADTPMALLGLPESVVGLLPGGGGTQRLPRLVPVDIALELLLENQRLSGEPARLSGLIDELVAPGCEIEAAEQWILSSPKATQPWDDQVEPADLDDTRAAIGSAREKVLLQTLGHYPAPLAILDCMERGLSLPMDDAIRAEMNIFSYLIQRPEPRDMIATLFLGRIAYERRAKAGDMLPAVDRAVAVLSALWAPGSIADAAQAAALATAGFANEAGPAAAVMSGRRFDSYWFEQAPVDECKRIAREFLDAVATAARREAGALEDDERRLADYIMVSKMGFPAYLGGPFALAARAASC